MIGKNQRTVYNSWKKWKGKALLGDELTKFNYLKKESGPKGGKVEKVSEIYNVDYH